MAIVSLPLLTDLGATPHYRLSCELDGATYTFEFAWNDRDGLWYAQIGDAEGNLLLGSQRVVLGKLFTSKYRIAGLPPGLLIAVDTSGQDLDAGLADLGSRVQVVYYPASVTGATIASAT